MTCVIGWMNEKGSYIGADRQSSTWDRKLDADKLKVIFPSSQLAIGTAGDVRAINVIQHCWDIPAHPGQEATVKEWDAYIIKDMVPSLRTILRYQGCLRVEDISYECMPAVEILIVSTKGMWTMGNWFSVVRTRSPFESIGSGARVALGALAGVVAIKPSVSPSKAIRLALGISHSVDPWVGPPPYDILKSGPLTKKEWIVVN